MTDHQPVRRPYPGADLTAGDEAGQALGVGRG
ncbi:hypothetical protein IW249_001218 [Micromonospora vinacea]|uniref:Uncharacterized protein n=1 Tax=Micromonospora vinacea TaxID=709878 RepID=A0ABS0JWR6_9ACTN|nr:hypothetical protein [Micromonospora vinacea]